MNELVETLNQLDNANIPYCVLRNFEFDTESLDGDVDVLVRSDDREAIHRILTAEGFYPFEGDTTEQTRYRGYLTEYKEIVTLDFYWDAPTYNGLPFLDGDRVLADRRRFEEFWVPSKNDLFIELVFHSVLNKNHYRKKYRSELAILQDDVDLKKIREHAEARFGSHGVEAVDHVIDNNFDAIVANKWRLFFAGIRRSPRKIPLIFWNLIVLREVIRPIRHLLGKLRPGGVPVVAFVGPDGVGKSTAVEGITTKLSSLGFDTRTARLGVHSGASPLLKFARSCYNRVTGRSSQKKERNEGTATLETRSPTWKAFILTIDWVIRYAVMQIRGGDVIVADRYLHELVVYANPGFLHGIMKMYKPTVGIVLEEETNALAARSEYTCESIEEFQSRLDELDWTRHNVEEDPDATVEGLAGTVVTELLSKLSRE